MDINQIGFIMPIKDVFYITGVGVIATGIVSTGELRTGELVEIIKTNGDTLYSKVVISVDTHPAISVITTH